MDVRQRRTGGVLAAVCLALCASGALAIGLLAPSSPGAAHPIIDSGLAPVQADASSNSSAPRPAVDPTGSAATTTGHRLRSSTSTSKTPTAPPQSFVAQVAGLPPAGEATQSGCAAAYAYLHAYAAPGFTFECPGDAGGHQAMTMCVTGSTQCGGLRLIVIADPCPAAYMNEASNSWALTGASDAPLDPYGSCG